MKKVMLGLAGLVVVLGLGAAYVVFKEPAQRAAGNEKVPMTAERLERGRYLFENVADCGGCHNDRNWEKSLAPTKDGGVGAGMEFPESLGLPGRVVASNLTTDKETGLGNWTDGEKLRALREGVSKDGHALFSMMPYPNFRKMSDEDAESIVAYMNTLKPVKSKLRKTELAFPVKYLIKFEPAVVERGVKAPEASDRVKYGAYLATLADCKGCHTQMSNGKPVEGLEFAGGQEFRIGKFLVKSANLTQDEETGIGKWSEDRFLARFKGYSNVSYESTPLATQGNFTVMPWMAFSQMKEDDLKAIYAYLKTVKAVRNAVDTHEAPPPETK